MTTNEHTDHSERAELIRKLRETSGCTSYDQEVICEARAMLENDADLLAAEKADGEVVAQSNKYAQFLERLPNYLIDNHKGEELTEELLQRAAADLYAKFPALVESGLVPFGILLLEERATTRQLVQALREATEPQTFMDEPISNLQTKHPALSDDMVKECSHNMQRHDLDMHHCVKCGTDLRQDAATLKEVK